MLKFIEECLPESAAPGSKAYRFTDAHEILDGTVNSISVEHGRLTYEIATVKRGMKFTIQVQDQANPIESHIVVVPGGYVDPQLLQ